MLGLRLAAALEDEAPGKIGHVAVDFRIEQIAQADETAGERHGNHQAVEYPEHVEPVLLTVAVGVPPDRQDDTDGAAMRGQAALPGLEYLDPVLGRQVVGGFIEETVAEPGAHDGADKQGVEQRLQQLGINAFTFVEFVK